MAKVLDHAIPRRQPTETAGEFGLFRGLIVGAPICAAIWIVFIVWVLA